MNIQFYPDELNYCCAKMHPEAPRCGGLLRAFLMACLRADGENYEILRPALHAFMVKYPPDRLRKAMEQHDAGMPHEPLDPLLYPEFSGSRMDRTADSFGMAMLPVFLLVFIVAAGLMIFGPFIKFTRRKRP